MPWHVSNNHAIMKKVLILGFGSLGRAFHRLFDSRYAILGVRRTPAAGESCPLAFLPIRSEALRPHLEWADVILFCPSSGGGDIEQYRDTYLGNMSHLVRTIRENPLSVQQIIAVGSTGVYPKNKEGVWTEDDPVPAESPRQEVLRETETTLMESGLPWVILRCGGLYGPGRNGFSRILSKKELRTSGMSDQPIALIHQDDVCGVIDTAIQEKIQGEIFNAVDDSHLRRSDLERMVADAAGIPIVDDGPPPPSPERVILNTRLKASLGYRFRYSLTPDVLKDCLASSDSQ
jgi:nucleoside-diphosphate-sugar epimerase